VEKFQITYQQQIMNHDKDVDKLLMMWKTLSEVKLHVEKALFGSYY
jgi:hypothetical protein